MDLKFFKYTSPGEKAIIAFEFQNKSIVAVFYQYPSVLFPASIYDATPWSFAPGKRSCPQAERYPRGWKKLDYDSRDWWIDTYSRHTEKFCESNSIELFKELLIDLI